MTVLHIFKRFPFVQLLTSIMLNGLQQAISGFMVIFICDDQHK